MIEQSFVEQYFRFAQFAQAIIGPSEHQQRVVVEGIQVHVLLEIGKCFAVFGFAIINISQLIIGGGVLGVQGLSPKKFW